MVSYMKKSLASLAGYGNPNLLPPAELLASEDNQSEEDDCTSCSDPCSEHKQFPSYLYIEQDFPMLGSVKPYGRHIVIATGVSDWPHKIHRVKGTFANSLYNAESQNNSNPWKNLITNSSMVSKYSTIANSCDVMILPDNVIISNVTCDSASDFYNLFIGVPLPTEPMDIDFIMKDDRIGEMVVHKNPYKTMLMLCSHNKTDKRCGITAPILAQEFDHVLREKDLDEYDVGIIMVSHIGGTVLYYYQLFMLYLLSFYYIGHQIAGNVICYINNGARGVWYGRVKTCHCLSIVEETIINGKVIKDLYRGAMDNSFENQVKRSILNW